MATLSPVVSAAVLSLVDVFSPPLFFFNIMSSFFFSYSKFYSNQLNTITIPNVENSHKRFQTKFIVEGKKRLFFFYN